MYKAGTKEFWEGESHPDHIKQGQTEDAVEMDFLDSYKKLIEKSKSDVPAFNAFEKIEKARKRRVSMAKRILPYAAIGLIMIGLTWFYQNSLSKNTRTAWSDQELSEIKRNTEMALLNLSIELNQCIDEIEKAQKARRPLTEIYSIEHFKIEYKNPAENLKIK